MASGDPQCASRKPRAWKVVHSDRRGIVSTVVSTALGTVGESKAGALTDLEFDQLICQQQRRVYRVLYSLTRDEDTANTLTQECFLKAYQSLGTFRGECRIDTWLIRI